MNEIEIKEPEKFLVYRSTYSKAFVEKTIERRHLKGLRIFDYWDVLSSLAFLREFTFLKGLSITCRNDQDYSFLESLPELERLSIGPSQPMDYRIDLSHQTELKYLSIQWRKDRVEGLDECRKLRDLCLVEFKGNDLAMIAGLNELERLRVKTGSMTSLAGIENLRNLQQLEIGNCRRLSSIAQLSRLGNLKSIRFETCRKISDLESLTDLPSLEILQVVNCGAIPDLDYRERFPKLQQFQLGGRTKLEAQRTI